MIIQSLAALSLVATVQAKSWATGDCTADTGEKISYAIHAGRGFMWINNSDRYDVFSEKSGDMATITHIGSQANMVIAVDLNTGRGYFVVKGDRSNGTQGNIWCKLGGFTR